MKTSDLLVKALENEGVEYIFGLPGEENLDFLESLRQSEKIRLVLTRHEQGAGFMAATYGRLTGKPGVCLATLGPGATNLLTPAAYAQLGAMPMVMITGQKPIKKSKQGQFQIVDVVGMMRPITKFTRQITHGAHVPSIVREAFRLSQEERPGAVHIELPEDVAAEEIDAEESRLFPVVKTRIPDASDKVIDEAAARIKRAKRPLLLIGAGANRKRTSKALTRFICELEIPFFNTQMGKGIVDERNPLYLGSASLSDGDFIHEAISSADLIINVGHDTIEKPPFFMQFQDCRDVIHIHFFPAVIDEVYFPQQIVIGDIESTINRLTNRLEPVARSWNIEPVVSVAKKVSERLGKYMDDNRFPILPQRLIRILRNQLSDKDIITLDNGMYKIWFSRNYPAFSHNTLLLDNALATMGAGLPSAIMAKELYPDRKVVSINGDGGFMMNSQELETAIRLGLDLVVIVLNDSSYGMIKWKQAGRNFPEFGLDYGNPDFIKYAESFGAVGHRADSVESLKDILSFSLNAKGIHLIDVPVDYSLNHSILNVLLATHTQI